MVARWGEVLISIKWAHAHVKCRLARETVHTCSNTLLPSHFLCWDGSVLLSHSFVSSFCYFVFAIPKVLQIVLPGCQSMSHSILFFLCRYFGFSMKKCWCFIPFHSLWIFPVHWFTCYCPGEIPDMPHSAPTRISSLFLAFLLHFLFFFHTSISWWFLIWGQLSEAAEANSGFKNFL